MKKNILKISLSVFAVAIIILLYVLASPKIEQGSITIIVIDQLQEEVINRKIEFSPYLNNKKTTLYALLENNFDIDANLDGFLLRIESVETDGANSFLKILLNDEVANKGIKTLEFKNGDTIKFVYTKLGILS